MIFCCNCEITSREEYKCWTTVEDDGYVSNADLGSDEKVSALCDGCIEEIQAGDDGREGC